MIYVLVMALIRYNSNSITTQEFTSYERCMSAGQAMAADVYKADVGGPTMRWGCFQK